MSGQEDSPRSVDFSAIQVVCKLAGSVTPYLNFKVTILFNVNYLEKNGTK